MVEAPVHIGRRFSSTINRRAIASILQETAAIFYRKHILHYYDRFHGPVAFDTLSTYMETELAIEAERRSIMRNVLVWLGEDCDRVLRKYYTAARARIYRDLSGHDTVSHPRLETDGRDEETWSASV